MDDGVKAAGTPLTTKGLLCETLPSPVAPLNSSANSETLCNIEVPMDDSLNQSAHSQLTSCGGGGGSYRLSVCGRPGPADGASDGTEVCVSSSIDRLLDPILRAAAVVSEAKKKTEVVSRVPAVPVVEPVPIASGPHMCSRGRQPSSGEAVLQVLARTPSPQTQRPAVSTVRTWTTCQGAIPASWAQPAQSLTASRKTLPVEAQMTASRTSFASTVSLARQPSLERPMSARPYRLSDAQSCGQPPYLTAQLSARSLASSGGFLRRRAPSQASGATLQAMQRQASLGAAATPSASSSSPRFVGRQASADGLLRSPLTVQCSNCAAPVVVPTSAGQAVQRQASTGQVQRQSSLGSVSGEFRYASLRLTPTSSATPLATPRHSAASVPGALKHLSAVSSQPTATPRSHCGSTATFQTSLNAAHTTLQAASRCFSSSDAEERDKMVSTMTEVMSLVDQMQKLLHARMPQVDATSASTCAPSGSQDDSVDTPNGSAPAGILVRRESSAERQPGVAEKPRVNKVAALVDSWRHKPRSRGDGVDGGQDLPRQPPKAHVGKVEEMAPLRSPRSPRSPRSGEVQAALQPLIVRTRERSYSPRGTPRSSLRPWKPW
eukprot:TRINITY_DN110963_c0_g1_i1.p1 TRINITY_DN110963_c0_g1~~TRINITY_DN110963_c0_g1_i1.p1  ORF type:complete len:643 (-),score=91.15 TRINITY_DN110963_c0_g1_i1:103-1920(-)